MKSLRISLLFLISALCLAKPVEASSNREVAVLTGVRRTVEVSRDQKEKWKSIKVGDFLYEGDFVKTGPRASAEISFVTGVDISVSEKTKIEIKESDIEQIGIETELDLIEGELFNRVRDLSNLEIKTPQAVAAVRGTEFGIQAGDFTRVYVVGGEVEVFNDYGSVFLGAGKQTRVESGEAPSEATEVTEDEKEAMKKFEKYSLILSMPQELVAGLGSLYELEVIDDDGTAVDVSGRVDINTSIPAEFSSDGVQWTSLPERIRIREGKGSFYLKPSVPGRMLVSCRSDDFVSAVKEQAVESPQSKELIIELRDGRDSYRLKMDFQRDD